MEKSFSPSQRFVSDFLNENDTRIPDFFASASVDDFSSSIYTQLLYLRGEIVINSNKTLNDSSKNPLRSFLDVNDWWRSRVK